MTKKRVISLILALLMLIQLAPSVPAAEADQNGPSITDVQVIRSSRTAAVRVNPGGRQARLILAVYAEDGQLLETRMQEVSGLEAQTAALSFSRSFPGQFRTKAMLVDQTTWAPLCRSREDSFQEPVTIDDFDPNLVLNFDEQRDENFAVLTPSVVPLYASSDFSRFETEDGTDFTLYGVTPQAAGRLKAGSRIILFDGENSYPVEADSVQASGDTVTLCGRELTEDSMGDFFQYFTVNQDLDSLDGAELQCGEGVTLIEQPSLMSEGSLEIPYAMNFQIDVDLGHDVHAVGTLNGTLDIHAALLFKKDALGKPYFFYDVSADDTFQVELELKGSWDNKDDNKGDNKDGENEGEDFQIPLLPEKRIPFPQAPFVEFVLGLTLPVVCELEAGFAWKGTIHSQYRMTGDNKSQPAITQDTRLTDCSFQAKAAFRTDMGVRARIAVEVLRKFLYVEGVAQAGAETTVELAKEALDKLSVNHPCETCFDGAMEPYIKFWIKLGTRLPKIEYVFLKREFKQPLARQDFYISLYQGKLTFGFGTCPHITYLCKFYAEAADTGELLPASFHAVSTDGGGDSLRDQSGYLHAGKYEVTAKYEGYYPTVKPITVDAPLEITLTLQPSDGGDVNEPLHGSASGTFINSAEVYRLYEDGYMYGTAPSGNPGMLSKRQSEYSWQLSADTRRAIVRLDLSDGRFDSVGASAFKDCTSLARVDLDPAITRILSNAFQNCPSLAVINIPDSIRIIADYAFRGCSSLRSPLSVAHTSIGAYAFADCASLPSVVMGGGEIGASAFSNCAELTWTSLSDIAEIPNSAFVNCKKLEYVSLPETLTSIGKSAFGGCVSLKELAIPNGVTTLGENAVGMSGLRSLTIPGTVTSMGRYLAANCPSLESVTLEEGVAEIPMDAFSGCSKLTQVQLPGTLRTIGTNAFQRTSGLEEITVPASVETIDSNAFNSCILLHSVSLSQGLRSIGQQAFYGCRNLQEITIPLSVTEIGYSAFADSGLKVIHYPGTEAQWNEISIAEKAIGSGVEIRFSDGQ